MRVLLSCESPLKPQFVNYLLAAHCEVLLPLNVFGRVGPITVYVILSLQIHGLEYMHIEYMYI